MARLDAQERAKLPNSAFAYVDSRGRRKLPIHDEAHVRNALARFGRITFDDDRARERARRRLLNAARKFRIVPVGFIAGQLVSERKLGEVQGPAAVQLPSGFVTLLMTDIEGSTALLDRLGDGYGALLDEVRAVLRDTTRAKGGYVVEERADEFFAVFECPHAALDTAITVQRVLGNRAWPTDLVVRVRIGIHSGYPTPAEANYIGMAVHTAARVCAAAHGGQILVSGDTREAAQRPRLDGVRFRRLGEHRLRGLPQPVALFQVSASGLVTRFPPPAVYGRP
jgi:class 3 adenylate cyclase